MSTAGSWLCACRAHLPGGGIEHGEVELLLGGPHLREEVEEAALHLSAALLRGGWAIHLSQPSGIFRALVVRASCQSGFMRLRMLLRGSRAVHLPHSGEVIKACT